MSRRPVAVAALLAAAALLAGCTGRGEVTPVDPTTSAQSPTPTDGPWPLTGLPGYPNDSQTPVLVVKIDNTDAGRPQVGIGEADLVVQELVEGGLTRLAVMYHSTYPDRVGAVRSMRETDIGIVMPTAGTLAASGASRRTLAALDAAGVPIAVEGSATGFSRDPARRAPHNLMLDVDALSATLPDSRPPGSYLPFGKVPAGSSGTPAAAITLAWPASRSRFAYDRAEKHWTRSDLADPTGFSFTNVLALRVPVEFAGGSDSAGTPVPTMITTGSGPATLVTGGRAYDLVWEKASDDAPWTFTAASTGASADGDPEPFTIPAGRTWIGLIPDKGGSVTVTAPAK